MSKPILQHGEVHLFGDYTKKVECYMLPGSRWNGWANPHFTYKVARRVLADLAKSNNTLEADAPERIRWTYNKKTDTFSYIDPIYGKKYPETWKGEMIETVDGPMKTYDIGCCSWCWDGEILDDANEFSNKEPIHLVDADGGPFIEVNGTGFSFGGNEVRRIQAGEYHVYKTRCGMCTMSHYVGKVLDTMPNFKRFKLLVTKHGLLRE